MAPPNKSETPLQSNYQDGQNFEIDIDQIYKDWITPIDNIRSFANLNFNRGLLTSLTSDSDVAGLSKLVKMEKTPQESRCHAFFRLLGFPVVSSSNTFYNPGFDIVKDPNSFTDLPTKLTIAKSPMADFNSLSEDRENYAQTILAIFADPNTIEAGVLALSSGGNSKLRKFIIPLDEDSSPFGSLTDDAQSYTIDTTSLVGKNTIDLMEYQNNNGEKPEDISLSSGTHIIKPFIVDARIDFTVSPQSRLVAVPFVPDNAFTKVSATENVVRPLLEKIIRDRLVAISKSSAGSNVDSITNFVKNVPAVQDSQLVSIVTKGPYKQDDQTRFIDNVNTIRTLMFKLVDAQKIIKVAQGLYYWVPVPSTTGPEGGCTVQGVFLPTVLDPRLSTKLDKQIVIAIAKSVTNNLNTDSAQAAAANDPVNFTNKTTFGPDTAGGLGDNNNTNLETLSQSRNRILSKAGNALRTVEIITGEFSGFGLCDIVAIIGALNIMAPDKLVGLLDDSAYDRMQVALPSTKGIARAGIVASMTELTSRVKDFYNLMDKIYLDINAGGAI
jgi:hypothetical protein